MDGARLWVRALLACVQGHFRSGHLGYGSPRTVLGASRSGVVSRAVTMRWRLIAANVALALASQSFNIGANASVVFSQPSANAVALNRVLGGSPSQIFGRLSSNGQVFLTNPSGILFGRGAQVDVGGFLATTIGMSTNDFMSGNYRLRSDGTNSSILNEGTLRSAPKGYVA